MAITALQDRVAAIVLVHNHPSGEAQPSDADVRVTRDLIRARQLLKIEVLDHVVIGRSEFKSLRELGYFV
jgi:DNA repair protein RadC